MAEQKFDKSDYRGDAAPPPYPQGPGTTEYAPGPAVGDQQSETRTVIIDTQPQGWAKYDRRGVYGYNQPDPVTVSITTTQQPGGPQAGTGIPQQPQTVIVTTQGLLLGPDPSAIQCPTCKQQVVTMVEYENGTMTWILVGTIAAFGCWLGCCLIPLCSPSCQDVVHKCPNCSCFLGRYRRCG